MRSLKQIASALIAAIALIALSASNAAAAQGRRATPSAAARREHERASVLATPIANARASLEKLQKDSRRKKYRDGWEAIASELAAAVHRAPADPRADEARLFCAQVRESLWEISRTRVDGGAAVASYEALDELHPGTEAGREGMLAAVRLAHRAHLSKELSAAAKRLGKYPRSSEVNEALALVPTPVHEAASARREPAPIGLAARAATSDRREPAPIGLAARAATSADRSAVRPIEHDGDDDSDTGDEDDRGSERAGGEAIARAASAKLPPIPPAIAPGAEASPARLATVSVAPGKTSIRAERAGRDAPPSPDREPDVDVPASAAHLLDQIVQAARVRGEGDLLGENKNPSESASSDAAAHPRGAGVSAPADGLHANDSDADSPEPEDAEDDPSPAPRRTLASAPRVFDPLVSNANSERRARDLRKSVLRDSSGSVAAQLGLKVRKIVVDAGHGGHDTGAIGPHGLREKEVTLSIARKLAEKLRAAGLQVVMTRDSDEYVGLNERTRIANEANADLFVSVHCNAARRRNLSGVETWTLNVSADRYAQRLASFENAEAEATVSTLRMILADLATKANASDARELAETVQSSLVKNLRARVGKVKDNGVKQALFYVLLGTHMPSILVETAFLSNPDEEKRLKSAKYQDGAAEAIARGVKEFIDARRELARAP